MSLIEAVHIFDEHNQVLLSHTYTSRPPSASQLISAYTSHPPPRPSLIHLPSLNPSTTLHAYSTDSLLFLAPTTSDVPPLAVLEFLHRLADALSEFLGSPLLPSRIETSYDLCAQILTELCDGGLVSSTEANALRDTVDAPSTLTRLLGGVGLPSNLPSNAPQPRPQSLLPGISSTSRSATPTQTAIPWRRANVRHTSNELYVDLIEEISATFAPSGRPLSAFANGSIVFNSKVSGVPDLLLLLSPPGQSGQLPSASNSLTPRIHHVIQRPVFHPCVRLNRWKTAGELSFVPPDGRFVLAGYEVDLLGSDTSTTPLTNTSASSPLILPVTAEITTNLNATDNEFQVRLTFPALPSTTSSLPATSPRVAAGPRSTAQSSGLGLGPSLSDKTSGPQLDDVSVTIPLTPSVRKVSDLRASQGEAHFLPADGCIRWRIAGKALSGPGASRAPAGSAVLSCAVVGGEVDAASGAEALGFAAANGTTYEYDENEAEGVGYQEEGEVARKQHTAGGKGKRIEGLVSDALMPRCVQVGFAVKGWLASGLRVEKLEVDQKRSRGLSEGVKPYKGVKYLTVSKDGFEVRC